MQWHLWTIAFVWSSMLVHSIPENLLDVFWLEFGLQFFLPSTQESTICWQVLVAFWLCSLHWCHEEVFAGGNPVLSMGSVYACSLQPPPQPPSSPRTLSCQCQSQTADCVRGSVPRDSHLVRWELQLLKSLCLKALHRPQVAWEFQ